MTGGSRRGPAVLAMLCALVMTNNVVVALIGGGGKLWNRGYRKHAAKLPNVEASIENDHILSPSVLPPPAVATTGHIFCNRELNMDQIRAVGFDMDYTLAQYQQDFDLLAYNGAKQKMVDWLGYPNQVKDFKYQHAITRRGCMIDKKRGNILKLDQHRYVRNVEHGLTQLSRDERKAVYRASYQETETFAGKEFVNIDTPFSLVDACLFAQLVDLKDSLPKTTRYTAQDVSHEAEYSKSNLRNEQRTRAKIMKAKSYAELWADMRRCIDRCHRDGVIKLTVAQDPAKYIVYDEKLFPMLKAMRRAGRKVFLLTNSLFDYTQVVMNYLEGKKALPEQRDSKWMEAFDLIIVGGNKPAFLLDDNSLSIYKVNPATGTLENCQNTPRTPEEVPAFLAQHGKVYQGGNAQLLHMLLQVPSGDDLLYVGDHIFADILRSKRSLGWRTCLIVPELQSEVEVFQRMSAARQELMELKRKQYQLENRLDVIYYEQEEYFFRKEGELERQVRQWEANDAPDAADVEIRLAGGCTVALSSKMKTTAPHPDFMETRGSRHYVDEYFDKVFTHTQDRIVEQLELLREEIRTKLAAYDAAFHPRWGQLFKAGFQESRISKQIKDYACIYTSKASNLGALSPVRPLRPIRDMMAHDHHLAGLQ